MGQALRMEPWSRLPGTHGLEGEPVKQREIHRRVPRARDDDELQGGWRAEAIT